MHIRAFSLRVVAYAVLAILPISLVSGCVPIGPSATSSPLPVLVMTEAEARAIAEQGTCREAGALAEGAFFNPVTGTWWIDVVADRPGCAPACVVDVATGTAEVNWRCTGLLAEAAEPVPPTDQPAEPNNLASQATPTVAPAESLNLAALAAVKASTELPADRLGSYGAASALDGSLSTPWCEGARGSGIGEWIELTFPGPVEVMEIGVDIGYDREADDVDRPDRLFTDNHRLRQASLIFSDEQQAMVVFEDVRGVQKVSLADAPSGPIVTTSIRLIIDDIYPGARFDDVCVAEIEVWGLAR